MKVYLDSVILVYFFDHVGSFQVRAAQRLAGLHAAGDTVVVSDLVRMECRMHPLRNNDTVRLNRFDGFFSRSDIEIVPITTSVFDKATEFRAKHGYKSIDSLNLAAAVEGNCDRFLTNDQQLKNFPNLTVEILP